MPVLSRLAGVGAAGVDAGLVHPDHLLRPVDPEIELSLEQGPDVELSPVALAGVGQNVPRVHT